MTAISSTHAKDEQARGFGATHFIASNNPEELAAAARSFDFILSTVSADLPWDAYMAALRPGGKLCICGIPDKAIAVSPWSVIAGEKSIVGGQPGSIDETTAMLSFAAQHYVKPLAETFPMSDANAALDHTRQGKARFRAVLVA